MSNYPEIVSTFPQFAALDVDGVEATKTNNSDSDFEATSTSIERNANCNESMDDCINATIVPADASTVTEDCAVGNLDPPEVFIRNMKDIEEKRLEQLNIMTEEDREKGRRN